MTCGDPPLSDSLSREKRSLEDDVRNGVKTILRKIFCTTDEVTCSIVYQTIERAMLLPDPLDHLVHRRGIPNVHHMLANTPPETSLQGVGRFRENASTPAANMDFGPESSESLNHPESQTGAASGDKNSAPGKVIFLKHISGV
jgi:hypothetical protein